MQTVKTTRITNWLARLLTLRLVARNLVSLFASEEKSQLYLNIHVHYRFKFSRRSQVAKRSWSSNVQSWTFTPSTTIRSLFLLWLFSIARKLDSNHDCYYLRPFQNSQTLRWIECSISLIVTYLRVCATFVYQNTRR